ncbi:MAG: hypothetical protein ABJA78_03830 [Ferruginibacter sp.]
MNVQTKLAPKAGKVVNTQHVEDLIQNYKKERWAYSSERLGKPDSLSVWYSVEELEDFLTMIKEAGGDGIKMHFGTYSADFDKVPEYAGRQTVVMLATKAKEVDGKVVNKNIYKQTDKGTSLIAYNFGTLCPPTCGSGDDDSLSIRITDKGSCGITVG